MSTNKFTIITADLNNLVHCSYIVNLINEYRCDPMGGEIGVITEESEMRLIEELKIHPSSLIYFARVCDTIIGMAVCFSGFSTFKIKKVLNIHDLILFKEFRKKGLGTRFLNQIAEDVFDKGFCRLTLEVRTDNHIAKKVYTKSGFSTGKYPMEFWVKELNDIL